MKMELFKENEIEQLRSEYSKINRVDPAMPCYTRLINLLDRLPYENLKQLAEANIKWVSVLARNRAIFPNRVKR